MTVNVWIVFASATVGLLLGRAWECHLWITEAAKNGCDRCGLKAPWGTRTQRFCTDGAPCVYSTLTKGSGK